MEKQQEKDSRGLSHGSNGKGKRKIEQRIKLSFEEALKIIREEDTELLLKLARQ